MSDVERLADRIVMRVVSGATPREAVQDIFGEQFGASPVALRQGSDEPKSRSRYENNKDLILNTYAECNRNTSATVERLEILGVRCSPRWLSVFLEKWGQKGHPGGAK